MQSKGSARWEPPHALVDRFAHERIEALSGRLRRAMDDNSQGRAILADAIGEAIRIGYAARVKGARLYPPGSVEEAWERWTAQWRLVEGVGERAHAPAAERALEEAGRRLDLTGGWGATGALRAAGRKAAAAGVALAVALKRRPEEPNEDASAQPRPSRQPWAQTDGSVVVAFAANQAEAELIQGRLELAGIPSALRRVASMDIPDYLAAGYREIHVPQPPRPTRAGCSPGPARPASSPRPRSSFPTGRVGRALAYSIRSAAVASSDTAEAAQPVGVGIAPSASLIRVQTFMLTTTATISSISCGLKCSASASWKR